jgi:hypothetical protein
MIATLACVAHPAKLGPEDGGAVRLACTACAKLTAQTGANSLVQHLEECKKIARQSVLLGARGPSLTLVRFLKQACASVDWSSEKQAWCRGVR